MIKLFALDVDGTLTDGGVYMDGKGGEFKRFDIQDGYGIVTLLNMGIKVVFISGRFSAATAQRAEDLKITLCVQGSKNKLKDPTEIAAKFNIRQKETAYAGDDIPDIECIAWSSLGMATANARNEVKAAADWLSPSDGGHGAIRDCAEHIIMINGDSE